MDIQEIRERRRKLEIDLAGVIRAETGMFNDETGVQVSYVSVRMLEVREMGKARPDYIVSEVTCDLDI